MHPSTAWNCGLVLNERDPASSFQVVKPNPSREGSRSTRPPAEFPSLGGVRGGFIPSGDGANPFTAQTAPIALRAKAKKIPAWKLDRFGLVGKLQDSPVKSDEPTETVTLIPMGGRDCASRRSR